MQIRKEDIKWARPFMKFVMAMTALAVLAFILDGLTIAKLLMNFFHGCLFADKPRVHHFRCPKKIATYQLRVEGDC